MANLDIVDIQNYGCLKTFLRAVDGQAPKVGRMPESRKRERRSRNNNHLRNLDFSLHENAKELQIYGQVRYMHEGGEVFKENECGLREGVQITTNLF